ncbi:MAG: hypothetical protein WCJ33_00620 [Pseudomonadota bacterium]
MNHQPPYYKKQLSYTITSAEFDIKNLISKADALESENKSLATEISRSNELINQLQTDEFRALHLCKMLKQRLDILETLLLQILIPQGRQYLTHAVIDALRSGECVK